VPDSSYTQDRRLLAFDSPLGTDVLLLQEFKGYEGISRLFSYELDLLAYENPDISFSRIVGQKVNIALQLPGGTKQRHLNGYVSRFTQGDTDDTPLTRYHAQVVPWLWFLTRQADCRIFQNMTAPDILSKVFKLFSFADFRLSLTATYPTLEYCVQYRETSFNFVSRIMEQFGIFYYFDHSQQGKHTLVLADQSSALPTCPSSPISYHIQVGGLDDPAVVNDWHVGQEVRTGKYTVTDYNFTTPSTRLLATNPTLVQLPASSPLELFDYPGLYTTIDEGEAVAKLRMQEEEVPYMVVSGAGNARALMSGYLFELKNHYRTDQNASYLVTEVQHFASAGQAYTTAGTSGGETYSNRFSCILSSPEFPYHPPRVTPKPFVQGPQPALVVGKSGEEIWVDNYGRVVVQFYWDRIGQKNENSSCWIRTSQPWAGENWGAMWIPRIGQEVLVSFLEGDPDRPIITGRVYNADQMPPYALPQYQTRSTFMSRSSKGGGSANYNEIRFEDLKGKEQIFMNAEKDMDLRVEKDSREFIGANRHLIVTTNQQEFIKADKHLHVKGNHFEKIDQNMSLQVGGNQMEKVTGNLSLSVTGKIDEKSMAYALKTDTTIHLNAGAIAVIEAGAALTLKVGGSTIDMNAGGVFITGPMVYINSGSASAGAPDASPQSPDAPQDPDTADDGSKGTKLN
jgi:type VI secretion system secreted protein VgrG